MPLVNAGAIPVARRDPAHQGPTPRYLEETVEFPVGPNLIEAISNRFDCIVLPFGSG